MTTDKMPNELILLPSLEAMPGPNGGLVLTQKYLSGVEAFAANWPGPVTSLVELRDTPTSDMDHVEVQLDGSRAGIELRPSGRAALAHRLASAAVALMFLSRREIKTERLCREIGVPAVFVSEYTVKTERQIVRSQIGNPLIRLRRNLWLYRTEKMRLKAIRSASGLQCSGVPTFDAYSMHNPNTLLFFDNRVPEEQVLTEAECQTKSADMVKRPALRLAFGGRLIGMKGVMDLAPFADALRAKGVPFTLDIYGEGPLKNEIQEHIISLGLTDQVKLRGALDFQTGWVPRLKCGVDLFVCCHPQGDPSSTYPEVMTCGVPIVGYNNEAFEGIIAQSDGGWLVPCGNIGALAEKVADLHLDRSEIAVTAARARNFAAANAFEPTMARRTQQIINVSRLPTDLKQAN